MAKIIQIAAAANADLKSSSRCMGAIAVFEGVVLRAYPDPGTGGKPWTIGIGHTSLAGPPSVVTGMTITREQAFQYLRTDLNVFESAVKAAATAALQPYEFDALVSLCLNIGTTNFKGSSVLRLLNNGDRTAAGNAFLLWNKANGHVLGGLVSRRSAEREMFLAASYPSGASTASVLDTGAVNAGVILARGCAFPDAVRALQTDLAALGIPIAIDGDFGAKTDADIRRFQAGHNLNVDGKAGPATRSAIAAALKAVGKAPVIALHPLPGDVITALAA